MLCTHTLLPRKFIEHPENERDKQHNLNFWIWIIHIARQKKFSNSQKSTVELYQSVIGITMDHWQKPWVSFTPQSLTELRNWKLEAQNI